MVIVYLFQLVTSFWNFKVANYGLHAWFGLKTYKWWDFGNCQWNLSTTSQSTNRTILFYIKDSSEQITAYLCKRIHQRWLIAVFPKHCNEMIEPGVVVQRALSGGSREGWAVFKFPALPRLWLAQQGGARDRLAQGVSHLSWQGLAQQLLHLSLLSLSISSLLLAPASAQCAKQENETKTSYNMSCTLPKNLF